jgi:nucleotide-binding universal stress UspA family protein
VALVELSQEADLMVAGPRGWGAFKCILLGNTTDRLVHAAHRPVLLVPSPARAEEQERPSDVVAGAQEARS